MPDLPELFVESGIDEIGKTFESLVLVNPVSNERDRHSFCDPERKHSEKALRVHPAVLYLEPYRTLI